MQRSKMNYRAWNHRCWLVSYMDREQVRFLDWASDTGTEQSKMWAGLHVADHSCFHYRMRLIIRILEDCCRKQEEGSCDSCVEVYLIWQEELDWNEELIKRYLGREQIPETQKLELREKIENERLDAMLKLVSLRGPPFGAI
ncbi:unnamed protein product [Linum tenue]|uniref:Uncharacterized protein n=1 Tax=Linum tenue TaxID=586396 RepID=A0AAV0RVB6_9ROSI|nr:unnamed protein product [Linum tenue]